jgi:hypothetical protein
VTGPSISLMRSSVMGAGPTWAKAKRLATLGHRLGRDGGTGHDVPAWHDRLARNRGGLSQLGPAHDPLIEVVVGDDGWLVVDVADVPADHADIRPRVQVQAVCDYGGRRDPLDLEILPGRTVALALDVGFPSVCCRQDGAPCCPADLAATRTLAAARTAGTFPAPAVTLRTTRRLAVRCALTATTTPPPCCSTPTPPTFGAGFTTYLPRHFARLAGLTLTERRAVFLPARSRAGVSTRFRIHDLRHTAASLMKTSRIAFDASFGGFSERSLAAPQCIGTAPESRAGLAVKGA